MGCLVPFVSPVTPGSTSQETHFLPPSIQMGGNVCPDSPDDYFDLEQETIFRRTLKIK